MLDWSSCKQLLSANYVLGLGAVKGFGMKNLVSLLKVLKLDKLLNHLRHLPAVSLRSDDLMVLRLSFHELQKGIIIFKSYVMSSK